MGIDDRYALAAQCSSVVARDRHNRAGRVAGILPFVTLFLAHSWSLTPCQCVRPPSLPCPPPAPRQSGACASVELTAPAPALLPRRPTALHPDPERPQGQWPRQSRPKLGTPDTPNPSPQSTRCPPSQPRHPAPAPTTINTTQRPEGSHGKWWAS